DIKIMKTAGCTAEPEDHHIDTTRSKKIRDDKHHKNLICHEVIHKFQKRWNGQVITASYSSNSRG
ncbi:hypothetical protein NQZ68_035368, partial [Dissostichus eleginoides]